MITPIPYGTIEPWWKAVFICSVFAVSMLAVLEIAIKGAVNLNSNSALLPLLALSALAFLQSWTKTSADNFETHFFALQLLALTAFLALLYRYAATEQRLRTLVFVIIGVA